MKAFFLENFQLSSRSNLRRKKIRLLASRIGITGTPGAGKKSIGKELSKLTGLDLVSLSDIAIQNKQGRWKRGEFQVDVSRVKGKIETRDKIVCGHLLPYLVPSKDMDFVAILRCSPIVLKKRYIERGYSRAKIRGNLESELLDLIAVKSLEVYGQKKVSEFDTTRTKRPRTTALKILATLQGRMGRKFGIAKWSAMSRSSPHVLYRLAGD